MFSFEFFPPKSADGVPKTKDVISRICELKPALMTVTYGAGGGTRELTRELTSFIAQELDVPSVAHLTCVGHTKEEINGVLDGLASAGVHHVLALRGDPPKGETTFTPTEGGFSCARDLVGHIASEHPFSVAVAGYPEGHPEATSDEAEMSYLVEKVQAGADVIITQLFFDPSLYFSFVEKVRSYGIEVPIVPGIMPISNAKQLKRFTSMCGASIPDEIVARLEELGDDREAVTEYGTQCAISLCTALLEGGAPGIHFYTLNKSYQVETVCNALRKFRADDCA